MSGKRSEGFAKKLLKFLCKTRLSTSNFIDQLYSSQACRIVLNENIFKVMYCKNLELKTLSSSENCEKEEEDILHMRDSQEDIVDQTRLSRKHEVLT